MYLSWLVQDMFSPFTDTGNDDVLTVFIWNTLNVICIQGYIVLNKVMNYMNRLYGS